MRLGKIAAALGAAALIGIAGGSQTMVSAAPTASTSQPTDVIEQLRAAQDQVLKSSNEASNLVTKIAQTQAAIDDTQGKIGKYQVQIDNATTEVKSRKAVLKNQLVALQKQLGDSATGNVYVDFLLNAKNFSDLVARGFTVNKLNQASQEALQSIQDAKAKAETLKQAEIAKKAELVANQAKLEAAKIQLDKATAQAKADATALQGKVAASKPQLVALTSAKSKRTALAAKALVQETATPATQAAPSRPTLNGGSLVANALAMQGVPYVSGGKTTAGVDCSGLVYVAGRAAGIPALSTYHTSQALSSMGQNVSLGSLQPGDLLFWGSVGAAYHVAIYVGGGTYVHAPKPGDRVHTASINGYRPNFARRL